MTKLKIIVVLCLVFGVIQHCVPVKADDIVIHTFSQHFDNVDVDFNERNPGVGLGFKVSDDMDLTIGAYHNSIDKVSTYAGVSPHTKYLGVDVGLITGYNRWVLPMVSPYGRVGPFKVNLLPIGGFEGKTFNGIAVGFSFVFDDVI